MIILEVVIGLIALLYIAEGYHDDKIERVQKTGDIKPIEAWHKADTYFHIIMNITVSYIMFGFTWEAVIFGFMMLGLRQIFMVIPLNLWRGRKAFYIGTTAKFDKVFKGKGWLVFLAAGLFIGVGYWVLKFVL